MAGSCHFLGGMLIKFYTAFFHLAHLRLVNSVCCFLLELFGALRAAWFLTKKDPPRGGVGWGIIREQARYFPPSSLGESVVLGGLGLGVVVLGAS